MNILLVSHGSLCAGALSAFSMFAPGIDCLSCVSLTDEGGVAAFRDELAAKLVELRAQGDVLIVADLKGGTPYNESFAHFLTDSDHIRLVAGMNLPMLVEAGLMAANGADLETVTATALAAGRAGVEAAEVSREDADDEDDLF